ncbi:E3 ubiquitin-protein ligase rnf14 [Plakobranchus ocellatus]|uniref:RBR-type E3 ubiquitin transferase n=1 Tax=Plakobranchus ocellatus TaxID=259542 RepID=A0AAV4BGF1_9GAST|nr:E3 ubiquitin-protein ligase rnf14 [Plakobranchus ocellatus]
MHLCEVCYDEFPGTQFFKMNECSHAFCHTCMQAFCELHITAGTVEELRCPTQKCDSIVPPYIIQTVLPEEAYDRWEKLLLQKTLDSMEDTVYCPRCGNVVIVEEEKELNLAHCPLCFFAFCTLCERVWHQGRSCETEEDLLEDLQQRDTSGMTHAVQRKFEELRKKLETEMKTKATVKKSTRPCPKCKIPVEKIGGCNKMTCKCGAFFCWVCGRAINGYNHFSAGSCPLFPGQVQAAVGVPVRMPNNAVIRMQAMLELNPDLQNNRCYCPMCKQQNLKSLDRNNHIKCWNCKTNFCFLCKQRISGVVSAHFVGPCTQHS